MSGSALVSAPAEPKSGSLRFLAPNATTFLSFACGLLAIRFAIDGGLQQAAASIFVAVCLDGLDGRLARSLNATSSFGAELDSLADCVSFGVAPAVVLYYAGLQTLGDLGWVVTTIFAGGIAFRLARFNAEQAHAPKSDFFVGVPAPAGAAMALLPLIAGFASGLSVPPMIQAIYLLVVTGLCVSRLPIYSGKASLHPSWKTVALPALVATMALAAYPWATVAAFITLFVVSIPFGRIYLEMQRNAANSLQAE